MQINIEINTHCNYRCVYCPQAKQPKPARVMPQEMFELVLDKLSVLVNGQEPEWVALNHYGEPGLDPELLRKAKALADRGWWLRLFTNASCLKAETAIALKELGRLDGVIINLPSLDPELYKACTGRPLEPALTNILELVKNRVPYAMCLNEDARRMDIELMRHTFGGEAAYFANLTNSRAGLVSGPGIATVRRWKHALLPGCRFFERQWNVAINGNLFMCCQDYHQRYLWGNLLELSPREIWRERGALQAVVQGRVAAPDNMICRDCVRLGGGGE